MAVSRRPTYRQSCCTVGCRCFSTSMLIFHCSFTFLVLSACFSNALSLSTVSGATANIFLWDGESAELPCQFEDDVVTVYWKKGENPTTATTLATFNNGIRTGSDNGRINISDTFSLMLSTVLISDEGMYLCQGINAGGKTTDIISVVSVAVSPQEPFPTVTILRPNSTAPFNSTCQYTLAEGTRIQLLCEVTHFRPSIELLWSRETTTVVGTALKLSNNSDGTYDASSTVDVNVENTKLTIACTVSGQALLPGETRKITTVICPSQNPTGSGQSDWRKIVVIIIIVIVLSAAVIGLIIWLRRLVRDTMVRSNYTKSVSADDETPSKTRLENFCHICYAACCPCCTQVESAPTNARSVLSPPKQEQKPRAPSAALKARLQQNRKKQQTSEEVPSNKQHESASMIEDVPSTSQFATYVDEAPPEISPKPTASTEDETLRNNPVHSKRWDTSGNKTDEETKF